MAAAVSGLMLTYLGQSAAKRERLDLSGTCRQSLPMLSATLTKDVILEADLCSPGPAIHANENQIRQVLANLVGNAREAIDAGRGTIHLSVKPVSISEIIAYPCIPLGWMPLDNAHACLEVSDTGCGIPGRDIEKIFDPFFTSKFTGRGLGLAVVLGIVRAHGGAVSVESEPGKGSTIRIFLPVAPDVVPAPPES